MVVAGEDAKSFRPPAADLPTNPHGPGPAKCEPRISLEREGDRIRRIHIECSCGQVIDLACVYNPPAA